MFDRNEAAAPAVFRQPVEKHDLRIVFKSGRDLNIFGVVDTNLKGQWNRYKTSDGSLFIVNPENINYIEVKA